MSFRKTGSGEILPEGELTKTAKQDWTDEDEKALDQEVADE